MTFKADESMLLCSCVSISQFFLKFSACEILCHSHWVDRESTATNHLRLGHRINSSKLDGHRCKYPASSPWDRFSLGKTTAVAEFHQRRKNKLPPKYRQLSLASGQFLASLTKRSQLTVKISRLIIKQCW